jgi:hypothetical protein
MKTKFKFALELDHNSPDYSTSPHEGGYTVAKLKVESAAKIPGYYDTVRHDAVVAEKRFEWGDRDEGSAAAAATEWATEGLARLLSKLWEDPA